MSILFITPSLEPGRDGIGDYTLRLAAALREMGAHVFCVSLADRFVRGESRPNDQTSSENDQESEILKLSADIPWKKRLVILQSLIDSLQPDLISLQYVPYGYHLRGLPWGLATRLSSLKGHFRWHVMFHELWIGWGKCAPLRERLQGLLQARIVRMLHRRLRPAASTSNPQHQRLLASIGIPSDLLPLFSNIPRSPCSGAITSLTENFFQDRPRSEWYLLGSFGAVYSDFSSSPWLEDLITRCQAKGLKPALCFIGHQSPMRDKLMKGVRKNFGDLIGILDLGPHEPQMISDFLQFVDVGIVTTPPEILGKSGVVAAMREHGLKFYNTHLLESGDEIIDLFAADSREIPTSSLEQVASSMLHLSEQLR